MELPFENKRLRVLIENKTFGSRSEFSKEIGKDSAFINRFFRIDKRSGEYPSILKSTSVLKPILDRWPDITIDWFTKKNGELKKGIEDIIADKVAERLLPYVEKIEFMEATLSMLTKHLIESEVKEKKS